VTGAITGAKNELLATMIEKHTELMAKIDDQQLLCNANEKFGKCEQEKLLLQESFDER
jgi:hypothetical protein